MLLAKSIIFIHNRSLMVRLPPPSWEHDGAVIRAAPWAPRKPPKEITPERPDRNWSKARDGGRQAFNGHRTSTVTVRTWQPIGGSLQDVSWDQHRDAPAASRQDSADAVVKKFRDEDVEL